MSLSSKLRTSVITGLTALILASSTYAKQPPTMNCWPYNQPTPEQTYIEETLPEINFDFSKTDSTNTISVDIIKGEQLKEVGFIVLSDNYESQFSNINWQPLSSIHRDALNATSNPFIFLPDSSRIVLVGKDFQNSILFLAESTYIHENQRTILIDRNDTEETLYMIKGSGPNSIAWIDESTLVSSGLRDPIHETPLGFFHIYAENLHQYCAQYNCYIEMASWITQWDQNFDVGIHAGYHGTDYGRPASHGCIRVPEEFISHLWDWRDVGDNVIIIGESLSRSNFTNRFNFKYYTPFKDLINCLSQYREDVKHNEVQYGYYLISDSLFLNEIKEFNDLTNEGCQRWQAVEYGENLIHFIQNEIIKKVYGYNTENFNI